MIGIATGYHHGGAAAGHFGCDSESEPSSAARDQRHASIQEVRSEDRGHAHPFHNPRGISRSVRPAKDARVSVMSGFVELWQGGSSPELGVGLVPGPGRFLPETV